MYKIRKVQFINHPVLKNLELDFCDKEGHAVDTVILAGENGVGKSTIINALYDVAAHSVKIEMILEIEKDENIFTLQYYFKTMENDKKVLWVKDGKGLDALALNDKAKNKYSFSGIFSDVDINFHAKDISAVTSSSLDVVSTSRRSSNDLPTMIKQLLVDIQATDNSALAEAARDNAESCFKDLCVEERIPRFTRAFNRIFENLIYSRVENKYNQKKIIFKKYGKEFTVDQLSSGEKQIVYRGCFLLKDVNAINGAFVFIDEPEISLHPTWQMKIMDYYKNIFTDELKRQTSQIFVVTHSPFVVHNDSRKNDKVIVLTRTKDGEIAASHRLEYYKCNSVEVVEDAFNTNVFSKTNSYVYLEGRTDEMYFQKALEIYGYEVPFFFKWVGYLKENGQEQNTGKDALNKASEFLISANLPLKNVCLFDCDTKRGSSQTNNVYIKTIKQYCNTKNMKKGIENALILDEIETKTFYTYTDIVGDYGEEKRIADFEKMRFCKYICELDKEILVDVFENLRKEIDALIEMFA